MNHQRFALLGASAGLAAAGLTLLGMPALAARTAMGSPPPASSERHSQADARQIPALGPLRDKLASESWWIRADAARSLADLRTADAAALLVAALDDPSGEARSAIRQAVVAQGAVAVPSLAQALRHQSERVRWQAAWALGLIRSADTVAPLLAAIEDASPTVRRETAIALVRLGGTDRSVAETLAQSLAGRLRSPNADVRLNTAWVLGELGSTGAVEPLVAALADPVAGWMAATALGALAAPGAVPALARTLSSASVQTRRASAWALGRIGARGVVRPLESAVGDGDAEVRYWSRLALEKTGTVEAVRAALSAGPTPWDRAARRCEPERSSARISEGFLDYQGRRYRLYPDALDTRPDLPSPLTAEDGTELVLAVLHDGRYAVVPATLRPADRQCDADGHDFPTLAATGLHSEIELARTAVITGRTAGEITDLARPGSLSVEGFIGSGEDIIDVLERDNLIVMALGLAHPDLARPLFHVWNMMRTDIDLGRWNMTEHRWHHVTAIVSHGRMVTLVAGDTKGGQLSVFDDGLEGAFWIEIDREPTEQERAFLTSRYPALSGSQMERMVRLLTHVTTGEMEPNYAMWYGFYESRTSWRADPIALAFIFGLRSLEEIEAAFPGRLYEVLTTAGHGS